ncbi:hypothetical protein D3C83_267420 [compost metagenome]
MAGQHHPALDGRADGGEQVGLAPIVAGDAARGDAVVGKVALHPLDQGEVGEV